MPRSAGKSSAMRKLPGAAALLLAFPLCGCLPIVAPIPVPEETTSASGKIGKLNLENIKPGVTRQEIEKQLADVKIDCGTTRVFWGRWQSSRMAMVFTYGGERLRKVHNLILEFDESGKLLRRHDADEKGLVPALTTAIENTSLPPFNEGTLIMSATHSPSRGGRISKGTLRLTGSEFAFEDPQAGRSFSVPVRDVRSITSNTWPYYVENSSNVHELISVTFHLSTKSAAGKDVQFGVSPTDVWMVIRWFEQGKSGGAADQEARRSSY